jgi:hypothetical protein
MVNEEQRKKIEQMIFTLRREIELFLLAGSTEEVESRRDKISDLERKLHENTTE